MTSPFRDFDSWLESPYTNRAREEAEFEEWCEKHDYDMDDPESWRIFESYRDDEEIGPDPDDARDLAYEREMDGY